MKLGALGGGIGLLVLFTVIYITVRICSEIYQQKNLNSKRNHEQRKHMYDIGLYDKNGNIKF